MGWSGAFSRLGAATRAGMARASEGLGRAIDSVVVPRGAHYGRLPASLGNIARGVLNRADTALTQVGARIRGLGPQMADNLENGLIERRGLASANHRSVAPGRRIPAGQPNFGLVGGPEVTSASSVRRVASGPGGGYRVRGSEMDQLADLRGGYTPIPRDRSLVPVGPASAGPAPVITAPAATRAAEASTMGVPVGPPNSGTGYTMGGYSFNESSLSTQPYMPIPAGRQMAPYRAPGSYSHMPEGVAANNGRYVRPRTEGAGGDWYKNPVILGAAGLGLLGVGSAIGGGGRDDRRY